MGLAIYGCPAPCASSCGSAVALRLGGAGLLRNGCGMHSVALHVNTASHAASSVSRREPAGCQ